MGISQGLKARAIQRANSEWAFRQRPITDFYSSCARGGFHTVLGTPNLDGIVYTDEQIHHLRSSGILDQNALWGYSVLTRTDDGWTTSKHVDLTTNLFNNWAIIQNSLSAGHDEYDVEASEVASHIANAIETSGHMPEGVNAILHIKKLPENYASMNFLYTNNTAPSAFGDTVQICRLATADSREPLHARPGHVVSHIKPNEDAQKRIDAYYVDAWLRRVTVSTNVLIQDVVPCEHGLTSKHYAIQDLKIILLALYAHNDIACDIVDYDMLYPVPPSRQARVLGNEFPMSSDTAAQLLAKAEHDLNVLSDVVDIWKFIMRKYRIKFTDMAEEDTTPEAQARYLTMLGEDLGIYSAVETYLAGTPYDYICQE